MPQVPCAGLEVTFAPPVRALSRAPPSGALTVLHELYTRLGALEPSLFPVSGSDFLCKVRCAVYGLLACT